MRRAQLQPSALSLQTCGNAAFTMVEIALCLAIIGIALVSIIGVLPIGMNTQRDNREETIINQDATVFMEAVRLSTKPLVYTRLDPLGHQITDTNFAIGQADLTNYVYAITNTWAAYNAAGAVTSSGTNGYTQADFLTNNMNIQGLLSTPEYIEPTTLRQIPSMEFGGISNHVVAYVHSINGPAIEKPPQTNQTIIGDSFSYRIVCVNAAQPIDTNEIASLWKPQSYGLTNLVLYQWEEWQSSGITAATDVPGLANIWVKVPVYKLALAANLHELRLTFLWPQLPNGNLGPGRQTFRTSIPGTISPFNYAGQWIYFYNSQSFAN